MKTTPKREENSRKRCNLNTNKCKTPVKVHKSTAMSRSSVTKRCKNKSKCRENHKQTILYIIKRHKMTNKTASNDRGEKMRKITKIDQNFKKHIIISSVSLKLYCFC